jgi:tetratricopeptide (TPR) repeat protein
LSNVRGALCILPFTQQFRDIISLRRWHAMEGGMRFLALLAAGAMWLVVAGPLLAASQRDWDDCKAALSDPDRGIPACTRIIESGGEIERYRAIAYSNRAGVYMSNGDNDRAIADASEAIRLDPKSMPAYFSRGRANLYSGEAPCPRRLPISTNQASMLNPKDAYAALWFDIAGQRSNLPSRLVQAISRIDMTAWPAPVIRLFLGQLTPTAVLAATGNAGSGLRGQFLRRRICVAHGAHRSTSFDPTNHRLCIAWAVDQTPSPINCSTSLITDRSLVDMGTLTFEGNDA